MTQSTIKPNCEWQKINERWTRENSKGPSQHKVKTPGHWRICSSCRSWADETVINNTGGFTCIKCL